MAKRWIHVWLLVAFLLSALAVHAEEVVRVGDSKGLYKALLSASGQLSHLSYRLEWAEFPATAPALEALASGAIDLRSSAAAPLVFALAAGAPLKVVAALQQQGTRASIAILVPEGSTIHTVAELRGKSVGTNKGSVGHHLLLAALQHEGIPFSAVNIRYLLPADAKAALQVGAVDAWSTWEPYVSIAEVEDRDRPVVDGTGLPVADGVWVASEVALAHKRPLLLDLLMRFERAQEWANQHAEAYAQLYASQTGLPLAVTRLVAAHTQYQFIPIDEAVGRELQQVADLYATAGVIKQSVNVSPAFDRLVWQQTHSH